ncbi:hypothetical protein [Falsirhodobacter halotolerans]|uniref:hypothetical protein n=1 Tax=Falsirhodobacter halotolerans TaxID=1146892 RepID=UPI001FD4E9C7|nr:hypothetical protein [Falsirhodobacter halotolerans]MCJ8140710.1 hypothetical protein [Falsirhodobacter halotolerans]
MAILKHEGFRAGIWHGTVQGLDTPEVEVLLHGAPVGGVTVTNEGEAGHRISVPVPTELLEDGVQTFLIRLVDGTVIGHFAVAAGHGAEDDLRAEVAALRAELDLLKRAFRRHCVETSSPQGS